MAAGHEVVEARRNGVSFCFKRKRAEPPAAPAASAPRTAARSHLLRTPAAALLAAPAATAVPAGSPYADEVELPRGLGERLAAAAAALPERAPPAQRLLAFAESIGAAAAEAEARRPGGAPRAATLAAAFQGFHAALAGALESGAVALAPRCAPPTPPTSAPGQQEVDQPDYAVDLAARKAGLRARLANFQRVGGWLGDACGVVALAEWDRRPACACARAVQLCDLHSLRQAAPRQAGGAR